VRVREPIATDVHVAFSPGDPNGVVTMPRYFFDLFHDRYVVLDPGGMSFEHAAGATAAADELARDLLITRSELRNSGSWIRVRDDGGAELYRASIDPQAPAPATLPEAEVHRFAKPALRSSPAATTAE
jgi:hypothetical protein